MSILNSKFDILRGYPNGSALVWPFPIKQTAGVPASIPAGSLVTQELSGAETVVDLATTPDTSSADPIDLYLVVEGNDDYSGEFVKKCATAKPGTGLIWETDDYTAGTYTPGTPISFTGGKIKVKGANEQIIGHVLEDRTATKGTVVVSA